MQLMERRYQDQWDTAMMVDYIWNLLRSTTTAHLRFNRCTKNILTFIQLVLVCQRLIFIENFFFLFKKNPYWARKNKVDIRNQHGRNTWKPYQIVQKL